MELNKLINGFILLYFKNKLNNASVACEDHLCEVCDDLGDAQDESAYESWYNLSSRHQLIKQFLVLADLKSYPPSHIWRLETSSVMKQWLYRLQTIAESIQKPVIQLQRA